MAAKRRRALYPGSFDPVTYGHIDLIDRARNLFEEVSVAVAINSEKSSLFSVEERIKLLKQAVGKKTGVYIDTFSGLMVDYARAKKIGTIIRGLRATSDFDYEFQMALTNRSLAEDIDTIFLMPSEKHFYLSSRLIKEIASLGGNVSRFVPPFVQRALSARLGETV
ncbi:MAG: pantetheine-phosphate adenylyltransferase [Candidatus Omnitrophica bacterium]|nr:pantetheine-phosphate adenylyltransferase [Candidatus Omnitrophota bacterium]